MSTAGWTIAILFWLVQPTFTLNVSSQSRMQPLDWSQWQVTRHQSTSLRFLQHSTGFQCARESCSRLWCWCGSVLMALLPATSLNSAFLLPLLQVISILRSASTGLLQVPRARTTISRQSFAVTWPSLWNSLLAALRRSEMTRHTLVYRYIGNRNLHTFKWQLKSESLSVLHS